MKNTNNTAYNELYLDGQLNIHRLLFVEFLNMEYDPFSLINAYLKSSDIREKIDIGQWNALNKGYKQLLNSIDYSICVKKNTDSVNNDVILMRWMADIYVLLQWMYNISSKVINSNLPANELAKIYNPLHEISEKKAVEKIYDIYFKEGV